MGGLSVTLKREAKRLQVVVAQWQSTGDYDRTALGSNPSDYLVFFLFSKELFGGRWGDLIFGALVQFGRYQHR